jgi:hypothetical protein
MGRLNTECDRSPPARLHPHHSNTTPPTSPSVNNDVGHTTCHRVITNVPVARFLLTGPMGCPRARPLLPMHNARGITDRGDIHDKISGISNRHYMYYIPISRRFYRRFSITQMIPGNPEQRGLAVCSGFGCALMSVPEVKIVPLNKLSRS